MTDVNRQLVLAHRPTGMVGDEHFELRESDVPEPADGEVLVRTLWFAFDPAQRGWLNDVKSYVPPVQIGEPMRAGTVGQVVASRHADYRPGDLVQGMMSWQDYVAVDPGGPLPLNKLPSDVPPTWFLGVLGVTGITAYFGLLDIGRPQQGDTVVVSGAAGATGSVAGQIARIRGARVIGIAGGPEKCGWLTDEFGFDAAIDYKNEDTGARLAELCGDSIDVYFDNVGGPILDDVLVNLAQHARIVLCGGISSGYTTDPPPGPRNYMQLVVRSSRMEGFIVLNYRERFPEAVEALGGWLAEGSIRVKEDIREGFENCPATLRRLFEGKNRGKQLLKVAEPPLPIS
ncbi:MAG: NADP-dependent oxidoreductase [Gammaproteobacteria bacterium]